MRIIMALPLLALVAASGALARDTASPAEKLAKLTAGLVPGPAVSCISGRLSTQLEAFGPTLAYKVSRGFVYINETTGGCERVASGDALVTRSPMSQICQGDIAQTVDLRGSGMMTGSCSLGRFVPYKNP